MLIIVLFLFPTIIIDSMNFRNAFLIVFLWLFSAFIFAANGHKYGKIPLEELTMTTYPNDTSASVVVLFKTGTTELLVQHN